MAKRKLTLANNPLLSGPSFKDRERGGIPYRELALSTIERDPKQPRVTFDEERLKELSHSIQTYGVLNPLLVKPGKLPGKYTIISGERRFRAAQMAGLKAVPVLLDQSETKSEERILAMQLVENLQRADLTPLERAHAIGALRDSHQLSIRDIAEKLGISKTMVQRSLEILNLPPDLLNALKDGASESKILLLAKIEDETIRQSYLKDLSVLTRDQIEKDLEKKRSKPGERASIELSAEDQRIAEEIQRSLGLKVRMSKSSAEAENGKLIIDFYSNQDLQELFRKLVMSNEV